MDRTHYPGYTPVTESRRLIAHGLPAVLPETLGGRHRFSPLSLYVGDRLAAAAFTRLDEVGLFWLDVWVLSKKRNGARWHLRGGSTTAAAPGDDPLAPSPVAAVLRGHANADEMARANLNADRWFPWPPKWAAYGVVRLAAEVGAIRFEGRRIEVPEHGLQALAWRPDRKSANVELLDRKDDRISVIALG